nr:hypothetical protein CFP56_44161 [Quercus suber]
MPEYCSGASFVCMYQCFPKFRVLLYWDKRRNSGSFEGVMFLSSLVYAHSIEVQKDLQFMIISSFGSLVVF